MFVATIFNIYLGLMAYLRHYRTRRRHLLGDPVSILIAVMCSGRTRGLLFSRRLDILCCGILVVLVINGAVHSPHRLWPSRLSPGRRVTSANRPYAKQLHASFVCTALFTTCCCINRSQWGGFVSIKNAVWLNHRLSLISRLFSGIRDGLRPVRLLDMD